MPSPSTVLAQRVQVALVTAFGPAGEVDPLVRPSQFSDFQANVALSLARTLHRSPRDVATALVEALDVDDLSQPPQVSGPGFVNFVLRPEWVESALAALAADPALGRIAAPAQVVVIDYSAPNVAKEMHVGHLRTTIVGDALARTLERLGHRVIRQNHIGDWGTPFGMLIEHLLDVGEHSSQAQVLASSPNDFYQAARAEFESSPDLAGRARGRVVALQAGDPTSLRLWTDLVDLSKGYFNAIYRRLDVTLGDADLAGESRYNDDLAAVCAELEQAGLAVQSDGALCVFLPGFTGREGRPVPLIVRKSDGGYGYATTDLATIRYRVRALAADRMLYVIGAPQHLHLQMVFETARRAGWLPPDVEVTHVQIGNVLGPDGKILKTRSGSPIRLAALLDEAVDRAERVLAESRPDLDPSVRTTIAGQVGIGAVKYADLSVAHDSEYTFDFDRMLALVGNTGPYLQYAAARIRSVFRRAGGAPDATTGFAVREPAERALGLVLLDAGQVVEQVGQSAEPHRLCGYLFEVAQSFTRFYEECPILRADDPAVRAARLSLCALTLRVLEEGLDLLGIRSPDQM